MLTHVIELAAIYIVFLLLLAWGQSYIIFPGTRGQTRSPEIHNWAFEELNLPVDGHTTCAWYMPIDHPRGVVLFSHGNGGNMDMWLEAVGPYRDLGFSVLLYDYGGYGNSTGKPSEQRCYNDVRAVWRWLTETKKISPARIVLLGRSLGSGVAAQLATEVKPGAVILESPFRSISHMARRKLPFIPTSLLLRHRFNTESKIPRITAPILFVHSLDDTLVPYAHGQYLYELANPPKKFLTLQQGGHDEAYYYCEDTYVTGLKAFLAPLFP
ncbi:MAG: alpha/beta hydrolase [FCB group bacterium]|nr:alpha/beta hydrolase [FCB group bacterium]